MASGSRPRPALAPVTMTGLLMIPVRKSGSNNVAGRSSGET